MIARARILPLDLELRGTANRAGAATRGSFMDASADVPRRSFAFGLERAGYLGLAWPRLTVVLIILVSMLAGWGLTRLKVDNSLSELFRTDTEEFRRYEEIDRRFPSSEYDVLVVVGGQGSAQEASARGIPARHHRSAADGRGGGSRLHAVGARQARRHGLCSAYRSRRPARRAPQL